jgi:hypothetical protein
MDTNNIIPFTYNVQNIDFLNDMNEVSRLFNSYEEYENNITPNMKRSFSNKFQYFFYQYYLIKTSFYYSN